MNGARIPIDYDSELVKETASKYQRLPEQLNQQQEVDKKEQAAWRKNKVQIYNQVSSKDLLLTHKLIRERNKSRSRSASKSTGKKSHQRPR